MSVTYTVSFLAAFLSVPFATSAAAVQALNERAAQIRGPRVIAYTKV